MSIDNCVSISLYTFCDASKLSFATVIFLRSESKDQVSVQLVLAKSRIAPLKTMSIPRLELMACTIGVRLTDTVKKALSIQDIEKYYWTDSTSVLYWITHDDTWTVFVKNRVKEIRKLSDQTKWRHVPGSENPSDLPSRGCSVHKLIESHWWEGPHWLKLSKEEWPHSTFIDDTEKVDSEMSKIVATALNNVKDFSSKVFSYFSTYKKNLKMMGWISRFLENSRKKREERQQGELKVHELEKAEKVKFIQHNSFSSEDIEKLKFICVFEDEGILRVKTKLFRRKDKEDFKCPIVLPSDHPLVEQLIYERHLVSCHSGTQVVLADLREKFWILRGRKTVQRILKQCIRCKRNASKKLETMPAPLPEERVRDALVFEVTGVDLAGPLYLKKGDKAWILLLTCAV
ncbi:uncharacterized protein LOC129218319 [Uloborus diversus]|uniref:uncharacterized protein LOC129218319 n=1 Tax=Uloborus diversus TaxID=327109 RepID=UPI00240A6768|nr:uncharacterized protein LOC129218319 [Uloborus diversus]